jgi:hypothetical protein
MACQAMQWKTLQAVIRCLCDHAHVRRYRGISPFEPAGPHKFATILSATRQFASAGTEMIDLFGFVFGQRRMIIILSRECA